MRVSVALCTFNGARFLLDQLRSLAAQERKPDEIIICDDQSEDDTWQIIEEFRRRADFEIIATKNPQRLGATKNFEKAISLASGDIIFLCDQDDIWHPRKIRVFETVFSQNPQVCLVFSDASVVDQDLRPLGYSVWKRFGFNAAGRRAVRDARALEVLLRGNVVTGATAAFRSSLCQIALPIPSDWIHDGWLALIASAIGGIALIEEQLIEYRQHSSNQIGGTKMTRAQELQCARQTGSAEYVLVAQQYIEALRRLSGKERDWPGKSTSAARHKRLIAGKILHTYRRAEIHKRFAGRLSIVLSELITWRYFRYSNGMKSAAKDLFLWEQIG